MLVKKENPPDLADESQSNRNNRPALRKRNLRRASGNGKLKPRRKMLAGGFLNVRPIKSRLDRIFRRA